MPAKHVNNLGLTSHSLKIDTFKRKVAKWLIGKALYSVNEFHIFNIIDLV